MRSITPAAGVLLAAALLATAVPASASSPGASVVLDQPDGFTDPFTGAGGFSGVGSSRAVSADGRYVAFVSSADGLSGADDDGLQNVFRKDRVTGEVVLVSVAPDGRGANRGGSAPQISADGNRIAFLSMATNLDPAAVDGSSHLFVRDVAANTTQVVSRATGAAGVAVDAGGGAISGDGRVVAFTTDAALDAQDKNNRDDVYARRLATGETLLVSRRDGAAGAPGDGYAEEPSVNHDGSKIAFTSGAPLETADANNFPDVYRRTLTTAATEFVSATDSDGKAGDGLSYQPAISASGDAVAFVSRASNLDSQVLDDANGRPDVFVAVGGNQTQLSPVPAGHQTIGSFDPSIAGEPGSLRVAFETTLAADPGRTQVAVRTVATGQAELVSANEARQPGRDDSWQPSLAANGRVVAFSTTAPLGAGSGGDWDDVVARDLEADRTDLVSAPAGGALAEDLARANVHQGGGQLSPDARYAVFTAGHDGLGVPDRSEHVFLRDARTGRTVLVDRANGAGGAVATMADTASASGDGRIVAFVTKTPLVADDRNDDYDVYVRDTVAATTQLASRTAAGASGNDASVAPVVSADGRRVAFETYASDLGAGDVDADADVHVLDLVTGELLLASRAAAPADAAAYEPALNGDGSIVAFASTATNLDPTDTDTAADVFVRDLAKGTTRLASRRTDGGKAAAASSRPALSADGRVVAFQSAAPLQDDAGLSRDIYARDLAAERTTLVSRASGTAGAKADGQSELPVISADGTSVAFSSSASNLGGPASGVYVRRLDDATTTAMGRGRQAGLSADGACLMMASRAPDVIRSSQDYDRVVLRAVRATCELPAAPGGGAPQPGPVGPAGPAGPGANGGAPRLSGLSLSRRRFAVATGRKARTAAAVRRGTVVRFRLDRRAAVSLAIRQRVKRRWVVRGTLRTTGRAGGNRVAFSGRVARGALRPGRYVLVARARDAGRTSAPRKVGFRIVRASR